MKRPWVLPAIFGAVALVYIIFFTEWIKPEPIEIASQVRFALLQPRFGQPVVKTPPPGTMPGSNKLVVVKPAERVRREKVEQAPGGVANVTFSLDDYYRLTRIRVEDVPADGTAPNIVWQVAGKSSPTRSLLYGRIPDGMKTLDGSTNAPPLKAGVPYRLVLEAGRRRGTNHFTTATLSLAE